MPAKPGRVPDSQYITDILLLEKSHCFLNKNCATKKSSNPYKLNKNNVNVFVRSMIEVDNYRYKYTFIDKPRY